MDGDRFDRFSRAWAGTASRRVLARRLLGVVAGGVALGRPAAALANHKPEHCTKVGKRCHRRKHCCGGICRNGACASCAGAVAWADAGLAAVDDLAAATEAARGAIGDVTGHGYDVELVARVRDAERAVTDIAAAFQTIAVPAIATDPARALVEAFAAVLDALTAYLDQVSEESYIETGGTADAALATVLGDIPTVRAGIAELRTDCDGV